MVDVAKVRSFWRFVLFVALVGVVGLLLFWARLVLFYGATLPDIGLEQGRSHLVNNTGFIFKLLFIPMMISLLIIGYPMWRIVVTKLARQGIVGWGCFSAGAAVLAMVALVPFVMLSAIAGSAGDLRQMTPLFIFMAGVIVSSAMLVSHFLYRAKRY
ncbi:hypothetical protein [Loktanella sp. S4079]|uniref:hypothetical protein n=1 Tax=Loktanella sp. S4079 TaxID=579483 RepID=UPI0005F9B588|nr:hypothetical protein [Loktanella sp. S4079]KJZ21190.1 hypothetical protein TW80_00630 [Loktanella sp. S4079]